MRWLQRPQTTKPASKYARAVPRRREQFAERAVSLELVLIVLEFFPCDVRRKAVTYQHPALVIRVERTTRGRPSGNLFARVHFTMSPTVCTGVDRMVQHVQQRHAIRSSPPQFASVGAPVRTNRQLHIVPHEPLQ